MLETLRLNNFFDCLIKFSIPVGFAVSGLYVIYADFFEQSLSFHKLAFSYFATVFTYQSLLHFKDLKHLTWFHKIWFFLHLISAIFLFFRLNFLYIVGLSLLSSLPFSYLKVRENGWLKLLFVVLTAVLFPFVLCLQVNMDLFSIICFLTFMFLLHWTWMLCFEILDSKNDETPTLVSLIGESNTKKMGFIMLGLLFLMSTFIYQKILLIVIILITTIFLFVVDENRTKYLTKIGLELLPVLWAISILIQK